MHGSSRRLEAVGRAAVKARFAIIAFWALVLVGALPLALRFHDRLVGSQSVEVTGSESHRAAKALASSFDPSIGEQVGIVVRSDSLTVDDPAFVTAMQSAATAANGVAGVGAVVVPAGGFGADLVSVDKGTALVLVVLDAAPDDRGPVVRELAKAIAPAATPTVDVALTGSSPIYVDLLDKGLGDLRRVEPLGFVLAVIVLLVLFRSPVMAAVPAACAAVGLATVFGLLGLISSIFRFNYIIENLVALVAVGLGIDFSLFVASRMRAELAAGSERRDAAARSLASSGRSVLFSGLTVALSVSCLAVVNSPVFRQAALAFALSAVVMLAVAFTLAPALVAVAGARGTSHEHLARSSGLTEFALRRPVLAGFGALVLLVGLSLPMLGMKLGFDNGLRVLDGRPSGRAAGWVEESFTPGLIAPIEVVYASADALDDADMEAIARFTDELRNDPDVAEVVSITTLLDDTVGFHRLDDLETLRANLTEQTPVELLFNGAKGGTAARLTVIPKVAPDTPEATALVGRIRAISPDFARLSDAKVLVGGLPAVIADFTATVRGSFPLVLATVCVLAFLLLLFVFRSLVVPFKAVAMNLLAVSASLGLVVVAFQAGWAERLFGFESPGTTQAYLPVFAFAVLFGVSLDYEVFILSGIREAFGRHGDNERSIREGLQATSRSVTAAALVMVCTFGSWTFATVLDVKQVGFALAVAVALDAFVIRQFLARAIMKLAGPWNWWLPPALDRRLNRQRPDPPEEPPPAPPSNGADKPASHEDLVVRLLSLPAVGER